MHFQSVENVDTFIQSVLKPSNEDLRDPNGSLSTNYLYASALMPWLVEQLRSNLAKREILIITYSQVEK